MVGASPSTVLSWVDRGWLPAHRTPGGHRRIERQALVEFLRAHEMPEVVSESEPFRLLLAMSSTDEAKRLSDEFRLSHSDVRVEVTNGVVATLAHLFESPPDALLVDATLAGVDIRVLCSEVNSCAALARVRIVVTRPTSLSEFDQNLREVGVIAVLDSPTASDLVAECLALGNYELTRTKAS